MLIRVKTVLNDNVTVDFMTVPARQITITDEVNEEAVIYPDYDGLDDLFNAFMDEFTDQTDFATAVYFFNPIVSTF